MSVYRRKKGQVARSPGFYKDDRRILIACDDTYAPAQYFNAFKLPRVKVIVLPARDTKSAAKHALANLLESEEAYDERWLLLDVDHYADGQHVKSFIEAIQAAQQKGIRLALSLPCFEVWLLLHHADESRLESLTDCNSVIAALRVELGEYSKNKLRPEHFPLLKVRDAMSRSRRLDQDDSLIPITNSTRVHRLWESITKTMDSWHLNS